MSKQTLEIPAVWLPPQFFSLFRSSANVVGLAAPLLLIGLKILDRRFSDPGRPPWAQCVPAGFFGKIDDLSFWILVAGVCAVHFVIRAWEKLPPLPREQSECVTTGDLVWTVGIVLAASVVYVGVMLHTKGTFFSELVNDRRMAQVCEGVLNLGLIMFFYTGWLVSILTLRRAKRLKDTSVANFNDRSRSECCKLLANSALIVWSIALGGEFFFPLLKWVGQELHAWSGSVWFEWTYFLPATFKEIVLDWAGGVFVLFLYFSPWLILLKAREIAPVNCELKFNWFLLLFMLSLQSAVPIVLALFVREMLDKDIDGMLPLRLVCK